MTSYNEDDIFICFQFQFNQKSESIYAKDINTIELFLRQHNFLKGNQTMEEFHRMNLFEYNTAKNHINNGIMDFDEDDSRWYFMGRILKPFRFRSNTHDNEFSIISNDFLVMDAIQLICYELSDSLTFGSVVLNTEIEFISEICEMVCSLPKVLVFDFDIVDDHYDAIYEHEISSVYAKKKEYMQRYGIELTENLYALDELRMEEEERGHSCPESSVLYSLFMDDSYIELVQPITIEGYVNNFSRSLRRFH